MSLRTMYNTITSVPFFFCSVLVALFLMFAATMGSTTAQGFSIPMHTILSPKLPFFSKNLTLLEKHQMLTKISKSRGLYLQQRRPMNSSRIAPNTIQSRFTHGYSDFFYTEISIGTPPTKHNLAVDTGSSETWVQIQECKTCFKVSVPNLDTRRSSTFRPMPYNHQLCVAPDLSPNGKFCVYDVAYHDKSTSMGRFGLETFTFLNENGQQQAIPNLAFGCGLYNKIDFNDHYNGHFDNNPIGGILGLGRDHPTSIVLQLSQITLRKFSYCLPQRFEAQALLKFGNDAQIGGTNVQTTPFMGRPNDPFFLKVNGISVNGALLRIDPKFLTSKGGFVIDSGAPYSHIVDGAFGVLKQAVIGYFSSTYGWRPLERSRVNMDLCYQIRPVTSLPSVTLHFEGGADLELNKATLFQTFQSVNEFCMMVFSIGAVGPSILGAAQQANYRFLFDVGASRLSFVPDNC